MSEKSINWKEANKKKKEKRKKRNSSTCMHVQYLLIELKITAKIL